MVWQTGQPARVKITAIGSSPVTSGTMSGNSVTGAGTGFGEGALTVRSAHNRPKATMATIKALTRRSDMEWSDGYERELADVEVGLPTVSSGDRQGVAVMAHRNPIVRSSNSGSAETLAVTRSDKGGSAQDPPRKIRFSPCEGPIGFLSGLF